MKDLVILCGGQNSFEISDIIDRINACKRTWNLIGFVVTDNLKDIPEVNGYPVLGTCDVLHKYPNANIVVIGTVLKNMHDVPLDKCVSIIDPSCSVSKTAKIGRSVIFPNCFIGLNAQIGDYVICLSGSIINHDDVIGDGAFITSGVRIAGNVKVGAGCYLGQSCSIRQDLIIGENSFIGMGSVVVRDVPPNIVVVGNPAKKLRDNV